MSKVYNATWFYESIRTPDAVLTNDSSLRTYIQNNSITSVNIISRDNLPSGTTDITSSLSGLSNGYAGVLNGALYITGLAKNNKVYSGNSMECMFNDCTTVTSYDFSNFNTINNTSLHVAFGSNSSLTSIDVSQLNTTNVTNYEVVFGSCRSLQNIIGLTNWNTTAGTNFNGMFINCGSLVEVDLSSFDTSNVITMDEVFSNCNNITTIYTNRSWYPIYTQNVTSSNNMFASCSNLPNFSSSYITYTKATLSTEGGYMTLKQ